MAAEEAATEASEAAAVASEAAAAASEAAASAEAASVLAALWQAAVKERAATAAPATRIVRRAEVIGPGPQMEVAAPDRRPVDSPPSGLTSGDQTTHSRALTLNMPSLMGSTSTKFTTA